MTDSEDNVELFQAQIIPGDNVYNMNGSANASLVAANIMRFSTSALAAMDQRGGPPIIQEGNYRPRPAQHLEVKWPFAGAILASVPTVQFMVLIAVVWLSGKAIILEPSYITIAHLLYPVIGKTRSNFFSFQ